MKALSKLFVAVVAAAAALVATQVSAKETYNWRIETLWQAGSINQEVFERFADNVREQTDGQIDITAVPADGIVGVNQMFDATQHGILQGYHSAIVYWSGRNPVFAVLGDLNAAYETPKQAMGYFQDHGGLKLLREAYKPYGLYPIGVVWWGVESIPTTKPVRKPEDLKGLKIRMPQGMSSRLFKKFGAVPVNLSGTEVFSALDNGTIDATDWGTLGMNAELGLQDKAKYAIYPGVHSMPVGDVTIPLDTWNGLSPRLQGILTKAVQKFNRDMIESLHEKDQKAAIELREQGVELIDWSPDARKRFRQGATEVWKDFGEKNDIAHRAVQGQIDYLRSINLLD